MSALKKIAEAVGGVYVCAGYEPKTYSFKNREVEAIQLAYDKDCLNTILSWANGYTKQGADGGIKVITSTGKIQVANTGAWVVKLGSSDFIVVDDSSFKSKFKIL